MTKSAATPPTWEVDVYNNTDADPTSGGFPYANRGR